MVDQSDAVISSIECARKTMKWYKKMFFHLLDLAIYNPHALYQQVHGKREVLNEFILEVIREVVNAHSTVKPTQPTKKPMPCPHVPRLTECHFPSLIPSTATMKCCQRRCKICSSVRHAHAGKDTRSECKECDVGLCVVPCLKEYHTIRNY